MKTQITFEGNYAGSSAIEWLQYLEKCFNIQSATIRSYTTIRRYGTIKKCKVIVRYD